MAGSGAMAHVLTRTMTILFVRTGLVAVIYPHRPEPAGGIAVVF